MTALGTNFAQPAPGKSCDALAVWLPLLRRVDARYAHANLLVGAGITAARGDGVAVGDADNQAGARLGGVSGEARQQDGGERRSDEDRGHQGLPAGWSTTAPVPSRAALVLQSIPNGVGPARRARRREGLPCWRATSPAPWTGAWCWISLEPGASPTHQRRYYLSGFCPLGSRFFQGMTDGSV